MQLSMCSLHQYGQACARRDLIMIRLDTSSAWLAGTGLILVLSCARPGIRSAGLAGPDMLQLHSECVHGAVRGVLLGWLATRMLCSCQQGWCWVQNANSSFGVGEASTDLYSVSRGCVSFARTARMHM